MRFSLLVILVTVIGVFLLPSCGDTSKIREMRLLMNTEKWEQAVERGKQYLQQNPNASNKAEVRKDLAKCYLEWAKNLGGQKRFEEAVPMLDIIAGDYQDTPANGDLVKEMPRYALELGRKKIIDGKYLDAILQFKKILDKYPSASQAADARSALNEVGMISFNVGDDLWLMNADGSNPKKLAANAVDGEVTVPGGVIAFIRPDKENSSKGTLFKADIATGQETKVLDMPGAEHPVCSFDGKEIAVMKSDGIQVVGIDGKKGETAKRLPSFDTFAGWFPDGKKLLGFQHSRTDKAEVVKTDRTFKAPESLASIKTGIRDVALARDGKSFLLSTSEGLFFMTPGSPEPTNLIWTETTKIEVTAIAYSPDNRYILFIGKGKDDKQFRFYTFSNKKELKALDLKSDTALLPDQEKRISWGKGWIF